MKKTLLISSILLILILSSCNKHSVYIHSSKNIYKIAVVSDLHYMDPSLLPDTASSAFKRYVVTDGKLLAESDAIMKELISELLAEKPDLVLVPGDLTKDGESVSHTSVERYFTQLINAGIKVRVIDGNHDINNPRSVQYIGADTLPVNNIGPQQFRQIYSNCGYGDALYIDPTSLSYISEPLPGLWLFSIDACKYWPGISFATMTGGRILQSTMNWILPHMAEAQKKGKMVFGMTHPGIIEHFTGQASMDTGFVMDRWPSVSDSLMNAGLRIMFTGHFHANDITEKTYNNSFLYDIETGCPLVYPCPYRIITYIPDSALIISTRTITHINYPLKGQSFPDYARNKTSINMDTMLTTALMDPTKDDLPNSIARILAPRMRTAFMAHYAGDERLLDTHELDSIHIALSKLGSAFSWLRPYCETMWNDLTPTDNTLMIYLKSGSSFKK